MASLNKMKFKNFTWPNNPTSFNVNYEKKIIKHEFPDTHIGEIEDLALSPRTFSGSGVFFGPHAYNFFITLATLAFYQTPGILIHPKYGSFTVFLTKLTSKEEPLPDYVEYDFEFIEHKDINTVTRVMSNGWVLENNKWYYYKGGYMVKSDWAQDSKKLWYYLGSDGVMVTNQWVMWKGIWYYLGADGAMYYGGWKTIAGKKYYFYNDGAWAVDNKIDPNKNKTASASSSSTRYYTVIKGDTLSGIAKKFYGNANSWRKIADANKNLIKNPNSISVGWKLVIPY